ncbi:Peroxin 13, N-terminal region-domain-containing protein [Hysterangium stoloniferum]|nr:Peroxin 13, N-terminal region-domain-containing protein [Hysterangium stoloniferum]KAF8511424.1 Peroxin 13, N-terminal region-domain-containing protein [Hysterangium stoloniferum]
MTVDGKEMKVEDAELDLEPTSTCMQRQTFVFIPNIVQTFGRFSQMLESMYMATHSSFFAMVGVAEKLGQLAECTG